MIMTPPTPNSLMSSNYSRNCSSSSATADPEHPAPQQNTTEPGNHCCQTPPPLRTSTALTPPPLERSYTSFSSTTPSHHRVASLEADSSFLTPTSTFVLPQFDERIPLPPPAIPHPNINNNNNDSFSPLLLNRATIFRRLPQQQQQQQQPRETRHPDSNDFHTHDFPPIVRANAFRPISSFDSDDDENEDNDVEEEKVGAPSVPSLDDDTDRSSLQEWLLPRFLSERIEYRPSTTTYNNNNNNASAAWSI